jgi:hypothetical protein
MYRQIDSLVVLDVVLVHLKRRFEGLLVDGVAVGAAEKHGQVRDQPGREALKVFRLHEKQRRENGILNFYWPTHINGGQRPYK